MSERITNWSLALRDHLPSQLEELHAEVESLDREKAEKLALIAEYTDLLTVARRRVVSPQVLQLCDPNLRHA